MKWLLVLAFAAISAAAEEKKVENSLAGPKIKAPMMTIQYKGGTKAFNSPKILLAPFSQHLEFRSKGTKYTRDCKVGKKRPMHWVCKSPCSGGELKVMFEPGKGFDTLKIPAFKIQPSMCDQNSRPDDPWIESKKELVFKIKKMGTR